MYTNNDNYLQDLYNYNQMPNNYNQFMNNNCIQNPNMFQNQPNFTNGMYVNPNMFQPSNTQNLTTLYPSTYRIINPVVSRVVQNSNYQFLNEDTINNMVDTVFSIVDGQIDYREEEVPLQSQNQTMNSTSSNTSSNSTQTQRQTTTEVTRTQINTTTQNNRADGLLRDLIRILIIKEILSRRNNNPYMNF